MSLQIGGSDDWEMKVQVLLLPGDGIGPEISRATELVLHKVDQLYGLGLEISQEVIGLDALGGSGSTFPSELLGRCAEVDGVILGPVSTYDYPSRDEGGLNPSAELRTKLQLHANIRPCRSLTGLSVLRSPMDLIIVRENTEGFYSDRNMFAGTGEFMPDDHTALSVRKITAQASRAAAYAAFTAASSRHHKVMAVHKANVLTLSDGLFLESVREVSEEFPDVELEELIVDAAAAHLIRSPGRFDVLVTTNMFGDILSDEASELCGSLGLGGSINVGENHCVAQAQHGSAPDIAGHGVANPASLMRSAAMLLQWWGQRAESTAARSAARDIESAVDMVLANPQWRTPDLGGSAGTSEFTQSVLDALPTGRGMGPERSTTTHE